MLKWIAIACPAPRKLHTLNCGGSVRDPEARAARHWARAIADTSGRDDLKADYRQLAEHYATPAEGELRVGSPRTSSA
jgi:hypothetical protein